MSDTTRTVIRYKNRGRALVTVTEQEPVRTDRPSRYTAECAGCLDSAGATYSDGTRFTLREARKWAGTHAAECRALPQPVEQV